MIERWFETATGCFQWTPKAFWKATVAEYLMALKGWNRAQGAQQPMTRDEFEDLDRQYGAPSQSIKGRKANGR